MTIKVRTGRCFMMLVCSIAASSCAPKTQPSATCVPKAQSPPMQWSDPVNGLSLGIQVPQRPFIFVPKQGWTGPLIVREKDDKGRVTRMDGNPGGRWEAGAVLTVLLRNYSTDPIFWARDTDVWRISFSAPGFKRPPPWPGSRPPPLRPGPIRLDPQQETKITFPLSGAFDIWPSIPEGQYSVSVSYSPDRLLPFTKGWTRPYDVPGFWKGKISTPIITISVWHQAPIWSSLVKNEKLGLTYRFGVTRADFDMTSFFPIVVEIRNISYRPIKLYAYGPGEPPALVCNFYVDNQPTGRYPLVGDATIAHITIEPGEEVIQHLYGHLWTQQKGKKQLSVGFSIITSEPTLPDKPEFSGYETKELRTSSLPIYFHKPTSTANSTCPAQPPHSR